MKLIYDTNPSEDAALAFVTAQENARRAAENPPLVPLTEAEYFAQVWGGALASYGRQEVDADLATVKTKLDAHPDKRAAILAAVEDAAK